MTDDLLTDLIPFVEKTYAMKAGRAYRALARLSMGGGQSLNTGCGSSLPNSRRRGCKAAGAHPVPGFRFPLFLGQGRTQGVWWHLVRIAKKSGAPPCTMKHTTLQWLCGAPI
jgi:hypothetical protein